MWKIIMFIDFERHIILLMFKSNDVSSIVSHMSASSENLRAHCVSSLNQLLNYAKFLVFIVAALKRQVNIAFP